MDQEVSERWHYAKAAPTPGKECKDCKAAGRALTRPAPHPGPRCHTDHIAFRKASRKAAADARVSRVYSVEDGFYDRLLKAQGGRCAIAGCRATGKSKRLAVDHDHKCCPGKTSCGKCVRGLLCSTHNRLLGKVFDSAEQLRSMADYVESPPARALV